MNLGERIRQGRLEAQRTLEEVADATGISISYLIRVENNKAKNPGIHIVLKLCHELGWSPNEITGWTDHENERVGVSDPVGTASESLGETEWVTTKRLE